MEEIRRVKLTIERLHKDYGKTRYCGIFPMILYPGFMGYWEPTEREKVPYSVY